ncbi:hypothetical protein ILUMI_13145, partial [Ignelater luminosus]
HHVFIILIIVLINFLLLVQTRIRSRPMFWNWKFIADRPFIFYIKYKSEVLFIGRYYSP